MKSDPQRPIKKSTRVQTSSGSAAEGKWHDPFIEDLHLVRAKLVAKANGDMHQLILNARQTALKLGFLA